MHKQRLGQLLFCILSVLFLSASAQLLTNGDFNGCVVGAGGASGSATGWDNSLQSVNAVDAGFTTATTDCVTDFTNAATVTVDASQTVSLVINSEYDFSTQVGCIGNTATDQCTFSLTFGGVAVGTPLVLNASPAPGAFSVFIVNNIAALTVNTVVSLSVTETGTANGYSTSATLVLAGSGSADPHFVGFNGERFDFPGEAGKTYNLVSDVDVQVNTLLYRQQATKHLTVGGPVMKEIVVSADDHVVVVDCGGLEIPEAGFISIDGERLVDGQTLTKGKITASFRTMLVLAKNLGLAAEEEEVVSMAHLTIEDAYEFTFFFVEYGRNPYHRDQWITVYPRRFLDFSARLLDSSRKPHGILGQTANPSSKARSAGEFSVQGSEKDYEVADGLQGKKFSFNRFL